MALHVKKGDTVQIIAGDHKGQTGRVLHVYPDKKMVVVQGQNLVKKHVRPSRRNPQGGRISIEQPIHISKVLPVSPKSSKGSRVLPSDRRRAKKRVIRDAEIGTIRRENDGTRMVAGICRQRIRQVRTMGASRPL
jgi:large subunit ribosomal protein L24